MRQRTPTWPSAWKFWPPSRTLAKIQGTAGFDDSLRAKNNHCRLSRTRNTKLIRLDDDERSQNTVLSVLYDEEATLRGAWTKKKQELEAVAKLRENAVEAWTRDENRREQSELDEWAVLRRVA